MNEAVEINVAAKNSTVKNIQQTIFPVDKSRKQELLKTILAEKVDDQGDYLLQNTNTAQTS